MDVLFGYGDGRLLARTAASMLGSTVVSGAMPGITRKGVSLTREPGHLLKNLPTYALGMSAKLAMKRHHHQGQHNLNELVDTGRRLTAVDFISFGTLFKDVMEKGVAPWTAVIQSNSLEPWVLCQKLEKQRQTLNTFLFLGKSRMHAGGA